MVSICGSVGQYVSGLVSKQVSGEGEERLQARTRRGGDASARETVCGHGRRKQEGYAASDSELCEVEKSG